MLQGFDRADGPFGGRGDVLKGLVEHEAANEDVALILGEVRHGGANAVRFDVHLGDRARIGFEGASVEDESTLADAAPDGVDDLVPADVEKPRLHGRLPSVPQRPDRGHCRHKHVLCHILSCRQITKASERIRMHIGVETLEEGGPPLCLATLRGLYRLGEAVGVCQVRAAPVGFIEYQVGCDGLRDTGYGRADPGLAPRRVRSRYDSRRLATPGTGSEVALRGQVPHVASPLMVILCPAPPALVWVSTALFQITWPLPRVYRAAAVDVKKKLAEAVEMDAK